MPGEIIDVYDTGAQVPIQLKVRYKVTGITQKPDREVHNDRYYEGYVRGFIEPDIQKSFEEILQSFVRGDKIAVRRWDPDGQVDIINPNSILKVWKESLDEFTLPEWKKSSPTNVIARTSKARRKKVSPASGFIVADFKPAEGIVQFLVKPTYRDDVKSARPDGELRPDNSYVAEIRFDDWESLVGEWGTVKLQDLKALLDLSNVSFHCECPAWHWTGLKYEMTLAQSAIYPTMIPDTVWKARHGGNTLPGLCKHLLEIANNLEFRLPQVMNQIRKRVTVANYKPNPANQEKKERMHRGYEIVKDEGISVFRENKLVLDLIGEKAVRFKETETKDIINTLIREGKLQNLVKNVNYDTVANYYDNGGETLDRYTVAFQKPFHTDERGSYYMYLGASANPFHEFGQHGETKDLPVDRPNGKHLGKRIKFKDLPPDVQQFVKQNIEEDEPIKETWVGRLRDNYASFEEWAGYSDTYGLLTRLNKSREAQGLEPFTNPQEAWDANPKIQGSTDPGDFGMSGVNESFVVSGSKLFEELGEEAIDFYDAATDKPGFNKTEFSFVMVDDTIVVKEGTKIIAIFNKQHRLFSECGKMMKKKKRKEDVEKIRYRMKTKENQLPWLDGTIESQDERNYTIKNLADQKISTYPKEVYEIEKAGE